MRPTVALCLVLAAFVTACGDDDATFEGDGGNLYADADVDARASETDAVILDPDETDGGECASDDDCSDGLACNGLEHCVGGACVLGVAPPCTSDHRCEEPTGACDCSDPNIDNDGYDSTACGGDDCNDSVPGIHPYGTESCAPGGDSIDEDCKPETFQNEATMDGDGDSDKQVSELCFNLAPDGTSFGGNDCHDDDRQTYEGAKEECDYADNDCDGVIDEGNIHEGPKLARGLQQAAFYPDDDHDGAGNHKVPALYRCEGDSPVGYVPAYLPEDCDDTDIDINIDSIELCDGKDNDCDGFVDDDDKVKQPILKPEFTGTDVECKVPDGGGTPVLVITDCPGEPGSDDQMLWCSTDVQRGCTTEGTTIENCRDCGNECVFSCGREDCDEVEAISVSYDHSCAKTNEGQLACWGRGADGRLGTDTTRSSHEPSKVALPLGAQLIAAGPNSTCATLGASEELWCWGKNLDGLLGSGTEVEWSEYPLRVLGEWGKPALTDVTSVGVASQHACAVRSTGELFCWGTHADGRLGNNSTTGSSALPMAARREDWTYVDDADVVGLGEFHGCIVTRDKTLSCWGDNTFGQLGDPDYTELHSAVVRAVPNTNGVDGVAAGLSHTCMLRDGEVLCWGANSRSQLGRESSEQDRTPLPVQGLGYVTALSAGALFTCALDDTGAVWCWGSNEFGERGGSAHSDSPVPNKVDIDGVVKALSTGGGHACAVTGEGAAYCWGLNFFGQLGNGQSSSGFLSEPQKTHPLQRPRG